MDTDDDRSEAETSTAARLIERRVARRGLRPRVAASIIATMWLVAIVGFGLLIFLVDRESFPTVWDGMWWATQTVTTVGYGDIVPDQGVGQVVGAILMIGGLSFFAVITGLITSAFVSRAQSLRRNDPVMELLTEVRTELAEVRADLDRISGSGSS